MPLVFPCWARKLTNYVVLHVLKTLKTIYQNDNSMFVFGCLKSVTYILSIVNVVRYNLLGTGYNTQNWCEFVKNNQFILPFVFRLASARTFIQDTSVRTLPRRGSKWAHSAWGSRGSAQATGRAAPDVTHAVTNVIRAASHFSCASHVQHPIYFWNIQMQQLQHIKEDKNT
jgi:hypothetical protein